MTNFNDCNNNQAISCIVHDVNDDLYYKLSNSVIIFHSIISVTQSRNFYPEIVIEQSEKKIGSRFIKCVKCEFGVYICAIMSPILKIKSFFSFFLSIFLVFYPCVFFFFFWLFSFSIVDITSSNHLISFIHSFFRVFCQMMNFSYARTLTQIHDLSIACMSGIINISSTRMIINDLWWTTLKTQYTHIQKLGTLVKEKR